MGSILYLHEFHMFLAVFMERSFSLTEVKCCLWCVSGGPFIPKLLECTITMMRQRKRFLGLSQVWGTCVSHFPFFPLFFVSKSLQIQARICFHLAWKYLLGDGVFCVATYGEWCYQFGMPGAHTWAPTTLPEPLLWLDQAIEVVLIMIPSCLPATTTREVW